MNRLKIYAFADEASPIIDCQIEAMTRNRLDGLEIRNVDNVNVGDITVRKAREVRQKMEAAGLAIWSVGSPVGKTDIVRDNFEEHLEKFKRILEITHELHAENIRIFSFYTPMGEEPERYREEVIERMGRLLELADDARICLCHENEKGIYGETAERCLQLLRTFPQLKGVFDPANFVQCQEDTLKAWNLLLPYTKYLHIKDATENGSIVPAGRGAGNIATILSSYIEAGGEAITMEPHLAVFEGLSGLEREGEKSTVGEYYYESNDMAFDTACEAVREMLKKYNL